MIFLFLFHFASAQTSDWFPHYLKCFNQFQNQNAIAAKNGAFVFLEDSPIFIPHTGEKVGIYRIRSGKQNFYVSIAKDLSTVISKKPIPHAQDVRSRPTFTPVLQNAMIEFFEKNLNSLQIKYIDRTGYELDDEKKQALKHNSDIKTQLEICDKEIRQTPKPPPALLDHLKSKIAECNVPIPGGLPGYGRSRPH